MANILKQVVGIDVAQNELVVSLGRMDETAEKEVYAFRQFANKPSGFKALESWVKQRANKEVPVRYVMEATGVYHEKLAYHLSGQGHEVSILLPNKVSNYMKSLDLKTVTDKTASQAICQFGLERKYELWQQPKKVYRDLKQLTRERDQIVAERTVSKNQLHAEQAEAFPNENSIARLEQRIGLCNIQEKEIKVEIAGLIKQDKELAARIKNVATAPGIGWLTVVIAVAETNGFDLVRNKKQLIGYSGLDVEEKESGTSVKKKPKISKKGNRHLRKAMHMPALTAIRVDERFKAIYVRLVSKHGIKMKAAVAVQRRLLELVYTLWVTNKPYDKKHVHRSVENIKTL
ncbi:IS110 family RNA-guided transposase [Mucilaginibacter pedocola]|uniref:Transposase n=1 Tax=Mucilaginibacter pedocola TaxID=1792845 RepID=A0A1S9PDG7_9SPHI|nr:IS110 family transposase [Mucilaginibacter pedocola]OOQ56918.1 transposase [Mucilaginibacter pedocola]OOQ58980.1 transposase [Mucilaginibacter pedocola]OOQ59221.1 transposase [Mucilaginibacter pedocola]OOQ59393.1 transposase [Mucilaginibacter pedocola]OOQ59906.1 transposase [Mucilaginibacter pedocola]